MKKLIFRNLIYDIFNFFLISSIVVSLIVWVIQAVNFLDFVSEDGHSLKVYFTYVLLIIPKIFSDILLFIFFISIFYILLKYENNNEILIFWTNGIKKIDLIKNILKFSIFVFIFQLLLTNFIIPQSQDHARSIIRGSKIDYFPSLIKQKQFIDTVEGLTIFVDEKKTSGDMHKIFLSDKISNEETRIIYAKNGYIFNDGKNNYINLINGKIINIDDKRTNFIKFEKTLINLSNYTTKTITHPKIQELNTLLLSRCVHSYLILNIEYSTPIFSCEKVTIDSIIKELFDRLFSPIYILILSFVASLLILKSKNNVDYNKYKIILFFIGLLVIIYSKFSIEYISIGNFNSMVILFIPIVISLILFFKITMNLKTNL